MEIHQNYLKVGNLLEQLKIRSKFNKISGNIIVLQPTNKVHWKCTTIIGNRNLKGTQDIQLNKMKGNHPGAAQDGIQLISIQIPIENERGLAQDRI